MKLELAIAKSVEAVVEVAVDEFAEIPEAVTSDFELIGLLLCGCPPEGAIGEGEEEVEEIVEYCEGVERGLPNYERKEGMYSHLSDFESSISSTTQINKNHMRKQAHQSCQSAWNIPLEVEITRVLLWKVSLCCMMPADGLPGARAYRRSRGSITFQVAGAGEELCHDWYALPSSTSIGRRRITTDACMKLHEDAWRASVRRRQGQGSMAITTLIDLAEHDRLIEGQNWRMC